MTRLLTSLAAAALVLGSTGTAFAGRRASTWVWDTETLPERQVELEQWFTERVGGGPYGNLWWGPTIGVTDQLEAALPVYIEWAPATSTTPATTQLGGFGLELRYRFATNDPVEAPKIVPWVRVAITRELGDRPDGLVEGDAVVSWQAASKLHLVVDLGGKSSLRSPRGGAATLGLAGNYAITDEWKVGAEAFLVEPIRSSGHGPFWATLGPDLAWTHGRIWVTGGLLFGLTDTSTTPDFMTRILWGVMF